jgi:hypothetical protein
MGGLVLRAIAWGIFFACLACAGARAGSDEAVAIPIGAPIAGTPTDLAAVVVAGMDATPPALVARLKSLTPSQPVIERAQKQGGPAR